MYGLFYA
jgi:hypothetical protein